MPETGRVLQFPSRSQGQMLCSGDVERIARGFVDSSDRDVSVEALILEPDVLTAVLSLLRETNDPSTGFRKAARLYELISQRESLGLFDEREYFLGDSALLAGAACRLLGRREEAELWLDRAEAAFRHTVNPAPVLANVAYARLAMHYDAGRYSRALDLLPSLIQSFERMRMDSERLKAQFLAAMCLKESGRLPEAGKSFEALVIDPAIKQMGSLFGLALLNYGGVQAQCGDTSAALDKYQQALPILEETNQRFGVAHLKSLLGEALRSKGRVAAAAEAFRGAIQDYLELEMQTWVAYMRVILAETLIALGRNREAEWEILAALPTIDEQKMVPEGFAALGLLRESVTRRQTDKDALTRVIGQLRSVQ